MTVVLFDIDGTLVLTGGAGARAMTRAFVDVFAVDGVMTGVSMAGRTDTWIMSEMARLHGLDYDDALFRTFHQTYLDYLGEHPDRIAARLLNLHIAERSILPIGEPSLGAATRHWHVV